MPKHRKESGKQFVSNPSDVEPENKEKKKRRNTIITAVSIIAVIAIVAGVFTYIVYGMPFQKLFIKVDNDSIKIGYFINRVVMSSNSNSSSTSTSTSTSSSSSPTFDIWGTMQTIMYELVVKQETPKYIGEVTEQDIDTALRQIANGNSQTATSTNESSPTLSDEEFKEWYRQLLGGNLLSEKEFRAIIGNSILQQRMQSYLSARVPTFAAQVHLYMIMVMDYDTAVNVKERIDGGEDFSIVAKELSIDSSSESGGDIGWFPYKVLSFNFENAITNLEIGKCSDPFVATTDTSTSDTTEEIPYAVLMITEKADNMEVSDDQLTVLQGRSYQDWLDEVMPTKKIEFHGLKGNYDSYTEAWLNYQIQKRYNAINKSTSSSTETSTTAGQ
jgi:hypothetical protein